MLSRNTVVWLTTCLCASRGMLLLQAPAGDIDACGCLQRQAVPAKDCAPVAVAHVVTPTSTGKRSMITSMKSGLTKMTAAFAIKSKAALGKKVCGRHC